ncbi:MAG TPA: ABC transporter substrate binding protein, partial [Candidatus Binatia bacterium]|nr:ABC transporter substrate binding protein [Candidatus Binatia bacterium]
MIVENEQEFSQQQQTQVRRLHFLLKHAAKNRLPAIYFQPVFVESGGLMSYATDFADEYRRAAMYVDKILKGAKPADLPI